jgi:DNA-binding HxlR family transcriptional regulator
LLLVALLSGTQRFSDLRRKVNGISEKMLAQTLQWLESDGFVERISYPVVPPHVEYTLTQSGTEIAKSGSAGRLDRGAPSRNYCGTNSEK